MPYCCYHQGAAQQQVVFRRLQRHHAGHVATTNMRVIRHPHRHHQKREI